MDEAFTAANAEASYNVGNGIPKPISKVPNSQPKEKEAAAAVSSVPNSQSKPKPAEIIVNGGTCSQYRDFANALPMDMADVGGLNVHKHVPSAKLQQQKLPAKLAAILSDPGEFICTDCDVVWLHRRLFVHTMCSHLSVHPYSLQLLQN